MFKFLYRWFSAKELIDWRIYSMCARVKLNAHMAVVMQLKSYEHLMYIQFWPCAHWIHQDLLLLRQSKIKSIKKYWSLPLTDLRILWKCCKWTINAGERYHFCYLVFFILGLVFLCKLSYYNNKLIIFFTLTFFSLANCLQMDTKIKVARRSKRANICWLYRFSHVHFFIKPFFKIIRFWKIKKKDICNSERAKENI